MTRQNGFACKLQAGDVVDMEFRGIIGGYSQLEDDDYVDAREVMASLKEMGKISTLRMFYNSFGGDAYDGFQIANRLRKLRDDGLIGSIEAHAEGMVASAATLPYLVADVRVMRSGSRFMIHRPWTISSGTADDLRARADQLDQTEQEAIDFYAAVSSLHRKEIAEAMGRNAGGGTYYTPKEAKNYGFATEVIEPPAIAANISQKARELFHPALPDDVAIATPEERDQELRAADAAIHPDQW